MIVLWCISWLPVLGCKIILIVNVNKKIQARIQGRWNGWIFTPLFLSTFFLFFSYPSDIDLKQLNLCFGSIILLQKFTPPISKSGIRAWDCFVSVMYSYLFVVICFAYVHMSCTYLILIHTRFKIITFVVVQNHLTKWALMLLVLRRNKLNWL